MNEIVALIGEAPEIWEIDYEKKVALDISEINIIENNLTKYVGTIEEYLKTKGFTEIHFHETGSLPSRAHYSTTRSCSFR